MGWKGFSVFMFFLEIALIAVLFVFDFSTIMHPDTAKSIILSLIFGVFVFLVFVLFSGLFLPKSGDEEEKEKGKRNINNLLIVGLVFMIISIIAFLNFYLYFKTLLGNDLLVSLSVDKENFIIKNGEAMEFNVKAKVLINPFCSANCSLSLEDLSKEEIISSDNIYLRFSSPLSKDYFISSNEESSGQRLYKVSLECRTIKSRFCYVNEKASKFRTKIISVDYELNDLQNIRKKRLRNITESMNNNFYKMNNTLNTLEFNYSFLNLSGDEEDYEILNNILENLLPRINTMNEFYMSQKYSELELNVFNLEQETMHLNNLVNELNSSVNKKINSYNSLVENVSLMYHDISYLEDYSFSNSSVLIAETFVHDFNSLVLGLLEYNSIEDKIELFNYVNSEKENLLFLLKEESINGIIGEEKINISVYSVNLSKIFVRNNDYISSFILSEPPPICCFKNECYKCLDNPDINYPVILVHGHSFNERLSAELSMEAFSEMANQMEKEGYIDAGYFYKSKYSELSKGYLGKINSPVVVEATYYLDTTITEEGSFIFDSKWEGIDTYSGRLNEIISNVKYLTGKDKVIIVAHSMGGLVIRRYIQLYGEDNLNKLILVGTPNQGINGFVLDYCPVFGADIECSEMDENSGFISELNNTPIPFVSVYNIIGLGCFWEDSSGDGIVKNESAYLSWADNIYVNGECSGVDFFHVKMIKPKDYPEIYEIIKEKIEE